MEMERLYDAIIIGGGPAGMSAAISAYENGIKDIIILEFSFFTEKYNLR